jgi:hypothetical protein
VRGAIAEPVTFGIGCAAAGAIKTENTGGLDPVQTNCGSGVYACCARW